MSSMSGLMTGLAWFMSATSFPAEAVAPGGTAGQPEVELGIGYTVKARQLVPVAENNEFMEGDIVVAWTQVAGLKAGFMQHVWYRDGIQVVTHDLPVGDDRRWRSWSRHSVRPGRYEVRVLAPDGRELAKRAFTVAELPGC